MDDASTVGGGLLGPLLAFIDAKKRGLLNDWNNPGQRLTQINEDARAFNRDQRYNAGAERSVIPEVADAARQQNVQLALNMGGLLGMVAPRKPVFDWSNPGGAGLDGSYARTAKVGNTEITYGVGKDGLVELSLIETPRKYRGEGSARAALDQFTKEADAQGFRIGLHAEPRDKGVTQSGLEDFYKSFGFRKNAGNKRDFSTMLSWIRDPKE